MLINTYIKQNKPLKVKKGQFTIAYIYADKVILHTRDKLKECLVLNWFPDSLHVPVVKYSELETNLDGYFVYEMPLYQTGRSVKDLVCARDYLMYTQLRRLATNIDWSKNAYNWHNDFITAVENSRLKPRCQQFMIDAYGACMNYSHKVRFEISPRNVAADNGRLILLDCFYITEDIKR